MNKLEEVYENSKTPGDFAKGYFRYIQDVLGNLDLSAINRLEGEFEDARLQGNTIFVAGNGGSAATATTMANDIGFDILKKTGVMRPFRFFALTDNTSVMTAIANDTGYENLFVNQLKIHYRLGDRLLVISASGNSPNLIHAVEWVKSQGGRILGFLGFDGGHLRQLCDIAIHVKTQQGEYGPVEDVHLMINHVMAHWFQNKLKGSGIKKYTVPLEIIQA